MAHVLALDPRPDVVIVTGDLVEAASPRNMPCCAGCSRRCRCRSISFPATTMRASRCARPSPTRAICPATGFLQYAVEDRPVRLIALDTLVAGQGPRRAVRRAAGLARGAARRKRQADDALHASSAVRLRHRRLRRHRGCSEGGERLAELVRRHGNVERVMCGHVHRPIQVRWAGTMASIAPSTAHQATLDLHEQRAAVHDDGAAGDRASPVAAGQRAGDARELHRNLRRPGAVPHDAMTVAQSQPSAARAGASKACSSGWARA